MKHANYWAAASAGAIIVLAVFLAVNIRARNASDESIRYLQQSADNALRYQLGVVASSFGKDLDEDEESFNQCQAAVSAAAALAPLTTFEASNDLIDAELNRFGTLLSNPANRETVVQHAQELREIFTKLNRAPEDAETTKKLADFSSTLKS